MSFETRRAGGVVLWFDAAAWPDADPLALDFDRRERGGGQRLGTGRGNALVWTQSGGREWVLRHYRRGGLAARVSADRYLWLGERRSRAWHELQLLRDLHAEGLPVPRPIAARVLREGLLYRQDLVTERIQGARPLSDVLQERTLSPDTWASIGRMLARFRQAGVGHADLNAANILLDEAGRSFLIDFDRGRRPAGAAFQARSIARLHRSLQKWSGKAPGFHFAPADWQALTGALAA